MEFNRFWQESPKPMIGLSPMDGVTDACFRLVVARQGKPDLILTEFTNVEGICHGAESELSGLIFDESERPIVAQIYGKEPEAYFQVAQLVCELGFDGLDINMGCPAKSVAARGCGAGLIRDPERAQAIITAARQGIESWVKGASPVLLKEHAKVAAWFARQNKPARPVEGRKAIQVSVKTRLGVKENTITQWLPTLLEMKPAAISIHGRTLAQGYKGFSDWSAIALAKSMALGSGTLILGNGDIASLEDARQRIEQTKVDGVLIGRAVLGNPWLFRHKEMVRQNITVPAPSLTLAQRLGVALEHARQFERIRGLSRFVAMRKHLDWYCRGFRNASDARALLVRTNTADEVESILAPLMEDPELVSLVPGSLGHLLHPSSRSAQEALLAQGAQR